MRKASCFSRRVNHSPFVTNRSIIIKKQKILLTFLALLASLGLLIASILSFNNASGTLPPFLEASWNEILLTFEQGLQFLWIGGVLLLITLIIRRSKKQQDAVWGVTYP